MHLANITPRLLWWRRMSRIKRRYGWDRGEWGKGGWVPFFLSFSLFLCVCVGWDGYMGLVDAILILIWGSLLISFIIINCCCFSPFHFMNQWNKKTLNAFLCSFVIVIFLISLIIIGTPKRIEFERKRKRYEDYIDDDEDIDDDDDRITTRRTRRRTKRKTGFVSSLFFTSFLFIHFSFIFFY